MPQAVHKHILSGDLVPSLSRCLSSRHLRHHPKHKPPHRKPYDWAFSDSEDSDSDNDTSITSDDSRDWSRDDDSIDHNNNHEHKNINHQHNNIYYGMSTTPMIQWIVCRICRIWHFCKECNKSGMIDGNIHIWIGMLTLHNFNMRACLKTST